MRSWRKGGARVGRRGGTVSDACWPGPERRARGVRARGEEDSPPCAEGGAGGVRGGERCRCMHVPDWIEPRKGRRSVPGRSETKTGPRTHLRNVRGAAINTHDEDCGPSGGGLGWVGLGWGVGGGVGGGGVSSDEVVVCVWRAGLAGSRGRRGRGAPKSSDPTGVAGRFKISGSRWVAEFPILSAGLELRQGPRPGRLSRRAGPAA